MQQPSSFVAVTVSASAPTAAWSDALTDGSLLTIEQHSDQINWRASRPASGSYVIGMPGVVYGMRSNGKIENLANNFDPLGTDIVLADTDPADIIRPMMQSTPGIVALWLKAKSVVGTPIMAIQTVSNKVSP